MECMKYISSWRELVGCILFSACVALVNIHRRMKTNVSYGRSPSASAPSFVPVVRSLGFTSAGIAAGSWAAGHMSSYGGVVIIGQPGQPGSGVQIGEVSVRWESIFMI
ncbi:hypothetical protein MPTK1_4g00730 [Marchantia polymorpha subsp. ruderalis]|uniref:Uncharacterized protein n=4 Tax=Marchantia polymorpha TaxID=3197 RepID=A0AAF6B4Y7_MARPO|nr:hypothetical protein MARPO_0066s0069 [Marchantia polymorpha]BBN07071.1 hypothetical protein Mp_4g00730 [Marchantia polymorpha subsp. ruderalis]|eukprot:PTQ36113.1 hypothetical protein MARPO_0066s0069 [Marchantia polymorpha]